MKKLTCGCLNVRIHTKAVSLDPINVSNLGVDVTNCDEFFTLKVAQVFPDLEGVQIAHKSLLVQTSWDKWCINECVNCHMYTHATNSAHGPRTILVNISLKSDAKIIEALHESDSYSPLYKIVLNADIINQNKVTSLGVQSDKYDSIQKNLKKIQQDLDKYIQNEESAMENRIRKFEDKQRTAFSNLQSKARKQKFSMLSLILIAEEKSKLKAKVSKNDTPKPSKSPSSPVKTVAWLDESKESVEMGKTSDLRQQYRVNNTSSVENSAPLMSLDNRHPESTELESSLPKSNLVSTSKSPTNGSLSDRTINGASRSQLVQRNSDDSSRHSSSDDALFALDDFEGNNNQAFYDSDEEDDTDDSCVVEEMKMRALTNRKNANNQNTISCSVPIHVPCWNMQNKQSFDDEQDDEKSPPLDPKQMAASIKALARSVHGDGTELFGELPRSRCIATDFGNI